MLLGKRFLCVALFLVAGISPIAISMQSSVFKRTITVKTSNVEVELFMRQPDSISCLYIERWMWGTEGACPSNVVDRLNIRFKGKDVFLPVSSYADLSNIRLVVIEKEIKDQLYDVKISGGDAAFSYYSLLKFKGLNILSREVHHGEFPDDAWEVTQYHFNDYEN